MTIKEQNSLTHSASAPTSFQKSIGVVCISSAVLFGAVTTSASADIKAQVPLIKAYSDDSVLQYVANNADFRANHPLKLFVQAGKKGDRHNRSHQRREHRQHNVLQQHQIAEMLPEYIIQVASAREADLVIRIRQTNYTLDFRVIDVDQKDKKYKKDRRYVGGRCGMYRRAYYTKVKEKGEAYASYKVAVRLNGISQDRDQFTLRSATNFSYGTNLRAATNCGLRSTQHMPSNKVAKLFGKANQGYRHHIAARIKDKAASDLNRQIAGRILAQADNFYADLAVRLSYRDRYEEQGHLHSNNNSLLHLSSLLWRYSKYHERGHRSRTVSFEH